MSDKCEGCPDRFHRDLYVCENECPKGVTTYPSTESFESEGGLELNSLFKWYPLLAGKVDMPKTLLIPQSTPFLDIGVVIDSGDDVEFQRMYAEALNAVKTLGGTYPVFLKTDEVADKHNWVRTCQVDSPQALHQNMRNLLEFVTLSMDIPFRGFVVREFLDLPHQFHAFDGMPVAREFRVFIKNSQVLCIHPYWFPNAIQTPDSTNWLELLRKTQTPLTHEETTTLSILSLEISNLVAPLKAPENFWSIDFCQTDNGIWYMTDMALGGNSYHYTTCKYCSTYLKERYGNPEELPEVEV